MNPDNDFETLLAGFDEDEVFDTNIFVDAVMIRVSRHRRYRRIILAAVGSLVVLGACVVMMQLPASVASGPQINPFRTLILFALASLCGWAWVVTEDTRLPIPMDKIGQQGEFDV